jgi:hypothetical protein
MRALITLLLQSLGKPWLALMAAVLCGGAATAFYVSLADAGSNSRSGTPAVAVQGVQVPGPALGHQAASIPVVPEANPGLALIPIMAAMLALSTRRLCRAPRSVAAGGKTGPDGYKGRSKSEARHF